MIFQYLRLNMELDDETFNEIYPLPVQQLSKRHWTPVEVAKMAAGFLVPSPGTKVLDIGSGAGKFCLVGATSTEGHFTGVEQRKNLVDLSEEIASAYNIKNTSFIHANITEIDFSGYSSFYFYNSFHENIESDARIDSQVETSQKYYAYYTDYVNLALSKKPAGTRLVTYWSLFSDVPSNYELQFSMYNGTLKFWEKTA